MMCALQSISGMPIHAVTKTKELDFSAFAQEVQALVQADAEKEFFNEIVYDPYAKTFTEDQGEPQKSMGDLCVENDSLSVQTDNGIVPFTEVLDAVPYCASVNNGVITLTDDFQTARLIVKAKGQIPLYQAESVTEGYKDLHILQYASSAQAYTAYQNYCNDSRIEFVQPSHHIQLDAAEMEETTEQTYMTWGADLIGTEEFTKEYLSADLPDVVVAVIDTGINTAPALFDGRILDNGINISNSGNDTVTDDLYHGTHVTGTICELTPGNVKILPVKVFDSSGTASDEQIYLGIMYALEQGADILNMSFGGLGVSPLEVEAMTIADEHNVICCAASGNSGDDAGYYYPGSIASCITVGAVKATMERAEFSNFGDMVDVCAPGVDILSYTNEGCEQETYNGTSMATPHVSACCALLRSYDKSMAPQRAEALLRLNAVDLGEPGFDKEFAWGFVSMKDFQWNEGICKAPEFSRKNGNYGMPQTVELSTDTTGADIIYTTDGTIPDAENGMLYQEPLLIEETTVIHAVAVKEGYISSVPSEAVYMIGGKDVANAWTEKDGVILQCQSVQSVCKIPAVINGNPITEIAENAFAGNHFIQEVQLPDTVTAIGNRAFANCSALETITAKNVTVIGEEAFDGDEKLKSITYSSALQSVDAAAFRNCVSLKQLDFSGLTILPEELCSGCSSLETVDISAASVIEEGVFRDCSKLKTVQANWQYVTEIGAFAFSGCTQWQGDLMLTSLQALGEAAFADAKALVRVSLSEGITALPKQVFENCSNLYLLQLPGVTSVAEKALATGSTRSNLLTEIPYERITAVDAYAFDGFCIGGTYDTTVFAALETLNPYSFAGASAAVLDFPLIQTVPSDAFAEAEIIAVVLEQAETIAPHSVYGCAVLVLSDAIHSIAEDAYTHSMYIVAPETTVIPEGTPAHTLCTEPLIISASSTETTAAMHSSLACSVLACGNDLQYQWYQITADGEILLKDETAPVFYGDTSTEGHRQYRCLMTDRAGKSDSLVFDITVAAENDCDSLEIDEVSWISTAQTVRHRIQPDADGTYRFTASGAAPIKGILTDDAGRKIGQLQVMQTGSSEMTAQLSGQQTYYLETSALWNSIYAVHMTAAILPRISLTDCTVSIEAKEKAEYGTEYHPALAITAPDGTLLKEETDYITQIEQHNQYCIVNIFGCGAYSGYTERSVQIYPEIPMDTPIPVSLNQQNDMAVYMFVPRKTAVYYFYATVGESYSTEKTAYNRLGYYPANSVCASIHTQCIISDKPDGTGTELAKNSYSSATGYFFNSSVTLHAGQQYYLLCQSDKTAEYAFVISASERKDIAKVSVKGNFLAIYDENATFKPKLTVTDGDIALKEGVDYQRIDSKNDLPGVASVQIVGMGRYSGTQTKTYTIAYNEPELPETFSAIDQAVNVKCSGQRFETIWFEADTGESPAAAVRYRILNKRVSGTAMEYQLYSYSPATKLCSAISNMKDEINDYKLKNGIYCLIVSKQYADRDGSAQFTILRPYTLTECEMQIENAVYTGNKTEAPLKIIAPDGKELVKNRDYKLSYPDGNAMFGTIRFNVAATERTIGGLSGEFELYVDLPEDAPILTLGDHSAHVTYNDRLAVYRVAPTEDTHFILSTSDVPDIVLRIFSEDAEMLEQAFGSGAKAIEFNVPAGEIRYIMVKFNGTEREGTICFSLNTTTRLLSNCTIKTEPQYWTGEEIAPNTVFMDGDYQLVEGKDYTLRYTTNQVNIGTATANYVGMGDYFGLCDVEYDIIAEQVTGIEDLEAVPLRLGKAYTAKGDPENVYSLFRYTPGIDTDLKISVIESYCRLTMQLYDQYGNYVESRFFRTDASIETQLSAGKTCYILFAATDISGYNQSFKILLSDMNHDDMKIIEDTENGVIYRISEELQYAEVYAFRSQAEQITILPEINGIAIQHIPEGLFNQLEENIVVVGYENCGVMDYADRYHFIYHEVRETLPAETIAGDMNNDSRVSVADDVLLGAFLTESELLISDLYSADAADFNGDGMVDIMDYMLLISYVNALSDN
ncbi:MAG: S8 family serine peptidase [Oscillospiraceae bacterium]|nr:S8 family serine peptidase [Oscillospiraceae bacterium]